MIIHPLEPIYDRNSKILILGTMPSVKSRANNFYYAHPQNKFFKVLAYLFNEALLTTNEEKKKFLLKHNIALYDVIKSCNIVGSSDNSITDVIVNDFSEIIHDTKIKTIFTTGKKAYQLYEKYCYPSTLIHAIYLPSTSSANIGNYNFEMLVDEYKKIIKYLN